MSKASFDRAERLICLAFRVQKPRFATDLQALGRERRRALYQEASEEDLSDPRSVRHFIFSSFSMETILKPWKIEENRMKRHVK